jgi:hypothetical protein
MNIFVTLNNKGNKFRLLLLILIDKNALYDNA